MILHPGILALVIGSGLTLFALLYAAANGGVILRRWDYNSSSAYQLSLERRTYLVSTLVKFALGFQIASIVLFVYTMDDIHTLFVGAMCATGSLNANPIGWYALLVKIIVFFLAGFWIALNSIDQRSEEYPLVKTKYWLLLGLLPFIGLDFFLQLAYFMGLDPAVITSCCGSLFGSTNDSALSTLSGFPVLPAMVAFYGWAVLFMVGMALTLFLHSRLLRTMLSLSAVIFFILSIISVISFISTYIYELPTHHCPFDILQKGYHYIGYPMYLMLFAGVYYGILPGMLQHLKQNAGLEGILCTMEKQWIRWCFCSVVGFVILVSYAVYTSNLSYFT